MKNTNKRLSLAISLIGCLSMGVANATVIDAPASFGSTLNSFTNIFSINASDYVSEPGIFSDTINFTLSSAETVSFFANGFSGAFDFHQIDLIQPPGSFISGTGQPGPFEFSAPLAAGNYQVNYKGMLTGWVEGFNTNVSGSYLAGISIAALDTPRPQIDVPAVPEPETYLMMLAGLALIGVSIKRKC